MLMLDIIEGTLMGGVYTVICGNIIEYVAVLQNHKDISDHERNRINYMYPFEAFSNAFFLLVLAFVFIPFGPSLQGRLFATIGDMNVVKVFQDSDLPATNAEFNSRYGTDVNTSSPCKTFENGICDEWRGACAPGTDSADCSSWGCNINTSELVGLNARTQVVNYNGSPGPTTLHVHADGSTSFSNSLSDIVDHDDLYCKFEINDQVPPTLEEQNTPKFAIVDGPCNLDRSQQCIARGIGRSGYENDETCVIKALEEFYLNCTFFETETDWDYLSIDGVQFDSVRCPKGRKVNQETDIRWTSDSSVTAGGWEICADDGVGPHDTEPSTCPTLENGVCNEPIACLYGYVAGLEAVACDDDTRANACTWARDGVCDDGSDWDVRQEYWGHHECDLGTDCFDCNTTIVAGSICVDDEHGYVEAMGLTCTDILANGMLGGCETIGWLLCPATCNMCPLRSPHDELLFQTCLENEKVEAGWSTLCPFGSDIVDCYGTDRSGLHVELRRCSDMCAYADDGWCDDGSHGGISYCSPGTDCIDCASLIKRSAFDVEYTSERAAALLAEFSKLLGCGSTAAEACVDMCSECAACGEFIDSSGDTTYHLFAPNLQNETEADRREHTKFCHEYELCNTCQRECKDFWPCFPKLTQTRVLSGRNACERMGRVRNSWCDEAEPHCRFPSNNASWVCPPGQDESDCTQTEKISPTNMVIHGDKAEATKCNVGCKPTCEDKCRPRYGAATEKNMAGSCVFGCDAMRAGGLSWCESDSKSRRLTRVQVLGLDESCRSCDTHCALKYQFSDFGSEKEREDRTQACIMGCEMPEDLLFDNTVRWHWGSACSGHKQIVRKVSFMMKIYMFDKLKELLQLSQMIVVPMTVSLIIPVLIPMLLSLMCSKWYRSNRRHGRRSRVMRVCCCRGESYSEDSRKKKRSRCVRVMNCFMCDDDQGTSSATNAPALDIDDTSLSEELSQALDADIGVWSDPWHAKEYSAADEIIMESMLEPFRESDVYARLTYTVLVTSMWTIVMPILPLVAWVLMTASFKFSLFMRFTKFSRRPVPRSLSQDDSTGGYLFWLHIQTFFAMIVSAMLFCWSTGMLEAWWPLIGDATECSPIPMRTKGTGAEWKYPDCGRGFQCNVSIYGSGGDHEDNPCTNYSESSNQQVTAWDTFTGAPLHLNASFIRTPTAGVPGRDGVLRVPNHKCWCVHRSFWLHPSTLRQHACLIFLFSAGLEPTPASPSPTSTSVLSTETPTGSTRARRSQTRQSRPACRPSLRLSTSSLRFSWRCSRSTSRA